MTKGLIFEDGNTVALIDIENKNVSEISFNSLIREGIARCYNPFQQGCEEQILTDNP